MDWQQPERWNTPLAANGTTLRPLQRVVAVQARLAAEGLDRRRVVVRLGLGVDIEIRPVVPQYLDAVRHASVPAAITNTLETSPVDALFGGALLVSAQGELLAESPHGSDEILIYDLD